jgi:hypothetical protein
VYRPLCDRPLCDRPLCDRPLCGGLLCDGPLLCSAAKAGRSAGREPFRPVFDDSSAICPVFAAAVAAAAEAVR